MKNTFKGSLPELKKVTAFLKWKSKWIYEPNGVRMIVHASGAVLHWSSTTKRWWTQGKDKEKQALDRVVADCLVAYLNEQASCTTRSSKRRDARYRSASLRDHADQASTQNRLSRPPEADHPSTGPDCLGLH